MTLRPGRARTAGVRIAWQPVLPDRERRDQADSLIEALVRESSAASDTVRVGRRCERCGATDHGRPIVIGAPVHASVSYAGALIVVAVADAPHTVAVGVDAEHRGAARRGDLRGVIAPSRGSSTRQGTRQGTRHGTRQWIRQWTRAEAVLKADGRGLAVDPGRVRIARTPRGVYGRIVEDGSTAAHRASTSPPRLWRVRGPRGFVISLAVASV